MIHRHVFDNDLALLAEPIEGMASLGMTLLLPAGVAYEPASQLGVAPVMAEMMLRGAGELDARTHSDALDALGVLRSAEAQTWHLRLSATMMGSVMHQAMPLLLDTVLRPRLPEDGFEPAVDLTVQSIESLEDDPQHKVMVELKRHHQPEPIGRSIYGELTTLASLRLQDVRAFWRQRFVPRGAILALAGNVDFEAARSLVGRLTQGWAGGIGAPVLPLTQNIGHHHLQAETAQQHIGVAYDTVGEAPERENVLQRIAASVLSGGMSGRLFTEVREVRGLVYSVYASYSAHRQRGTVYSYAGTTPQRAAQTLEVLTGELRRMALGVKADEFDRAVVGMKSRLVMQGESTSARAGAIALDEYLIGRPRSLAEQSAAIDAATLGDLNAFLAANPPQQMTTLTIGPERLPATA